MVDRRRRKHRASAAKRKKEPPAVQPTASVDVSSRGWTLLAHPLLLDQLERLAERATDEAVGRDRAIGAAAKLLGHVLDLVFDKIPQDPGNPAFRHGGTLGGGNRHWFRAKTGNGRFRLFFRYHSASKVIVYAWLNDDQSLRTYGARTDAYAVFAGMLQAGNPPGDWDELVAAASGKGSAARLRRAREKRARRK